jgi:trigger factor
MQVTEIKNEGLLREYTVNLESGAIAEQVESQLKSMASRVKIPGFRPGHIPMTVLKQRFGKDVMGEVIERAVSQSSQQLLREKNLRPALQPKVEITSYEDGGDLNFRVELEVMPEVPAIDFSKIALEKLVCTVDDKEIDEAVKALADRNKTFVRAEKGTKAQNGSQVIIDFTGSVDGVEFEGGKAKSFALELGSGQFINGFEEQLVGKKEGDDVVVKVTFPEQYHKDDLAGKAAEFAVKIHEVKNSEATTVDEEFAKKLGFADVEALRNAVKEQFTGDYANTARSRMKKHLFDALEKDCAFAIPAGMMELEFGSIWEKLQQAKKEGDEVISAKSDDELRTEYTKIAERRVKLGILLSDVALKNKITVNQDELSRAVMQQAGQYPGQERRIFEFYQKNPQHLEELRGPILEEKAVDFILGKVKVTQRTVSREELMDEADESAEAAESSAKKPAKARKKAANE